MRDRTNPVVCVCASVFLIVGFAIACLCGCKASDSSAGSGEGSAGGRANTAPSASSAARGSAGKVLPQGFVAVEGAAIDPSGWPREIRCLKDDSVMVLVPAGEFQAGVDDGQIEQLVEVEAPYVSPPVRLAMKPPTPPPAGKLLTAKDVGAYKSAKPDVRMAIDIVQSIQAEGRAIPVADLERWRKQGRTADALLALASVQDVLARDVVEGFKDLPVDREGVKVEKGLLLNDEDVRASKKADDSERAAVKLLAMMQLLGEPNIAAGDLQQWRDRGRTTQALFGNAGLRKAVVTCVFGEVPVGHPRAELRNVFPPPRKAKIGAFYVDKYEVTNSRYRKFFSQANDPALKPGQWNETGSAHLGPHKRWFYDLWADAKRNVDDQPVACVSESACRKYAQWAGKQIPTRDEWTRAATGDGRRIFPWGSDFKLDYCCCCAKPLPQPATAPQRVSVGDVIVAIRGARQEWRKLREGTPPAKVGQFPHDVSPYGCYDMAGNVSEWAIEPETDTTVEVMTSMGGNAEAFLPRYLCPAEGYSIGSNRVLGFRTILRVK